MPTAVEVQNATRKAVVKGIVFYVLLTAVLFGGSGDWSWLGGWVLVALFAVFQVQSFRQMQRQPDLLVERSKVQPGTKSWDKGLVALIALVCPLVTWIVAALDHRFLWASPGPSWWIAAGALLVVAGGYLTQRAIAANPFFSGTVRIQEDRGQTVVSGGPYAYVRHPGYAGLLAFTFGTPLTLGSRWALLPAACGAIVLVLRTALEDRTLHAELDGYAGYAARVRSRLIPFVW
jgi:protein-S-isoprenylcysteine O-methyltransferase Ste14